MEGWRKEHLLIVLTQYILTLALIQYLLTLKIVNGAWKTMLKTQASDDCEVPDHDRREWQVNTNNPRSCCKETLKFTSTPLDTAHQHGVKI